MGPKEIVAILKTAIICRFENLLWKLVVNPKSKFNYFSPFENGLWEYPKYCK
jgi:hypothetical protein